MSWPTCPHCEKEVDPESRVCVSCGNVITSEHMLGVISTIDNAAHEVESRARSSTPSPRNEDDDDAASLIGKKLGKYELVDILGRGGMGTVYRAKHDELGHFAAIKVLERSAKQDVISRLFREAKAAARIGHVNIVQVHDFGRDPAIGGYIVMELVQGESLEKLLTKEGVLTEPRVIAIATEITAALAAAHAKGIVHRDLKPANVFMQKTATGELVKVMDFGIAKLVESLGESGTQPGTILGTPRYMSPEQWGSEPVDARSDIYSLGVMLYRMSTGALPHPKATSMTQLARAVVQPIKPLPREVRPELGKGLAAIIERCCEVAKEDRFASMDEVSAALRGLDTKPAGPSSRRLIVFAAAAACAIAFVVAHGVAKSNAQKAERVERDRVAVALPPAAPATSTPPPVAPASAEVTTLSAAVDAGAAKPIVSATSGATPASPAVPASANAPRDPRRGEKPPALASGKPADLLFE